MVQIKFLFAKVVDIGIDCIHPVCNAWVSILSYDKMLFERAGCILSIFVESRRRRCLLKASFLSITL